MLCEKMCDAGGPNRLSETIGNLGLWTRLGIPTKATRFKTHQTVRFLFIFFKFFCHKTKSATNAIQKKRVDFSLFLFYSPTRDLWFSVFKPCRINNEFCIRHLY